MSATREQTRPESECPKCGKPRATLREYTERPATAYWPDWCWRDVLRHYGRRQSCQ